MSEHDSFEERLRAMADEISRSMQRASEVDLDELAERYGIDVNRARAFADAAGQWLSDHLSGNEPFFGQARPQEPSRPTPESAPDVAGRTGADTEEGERSTRPGPHPLDLATDEQGVALSALDSGRWTVRAGSNQLAGNGEGPSPPVAFDLVSELRARDWITADGTLTLVGHHALARWCRTASDPGDATLA
ncbi:MAG: hypothetical protein WAL63_05855 [Solirubrobacteraceae bacterium]